MSKETGQSYSFKNKNESWWEELPASVKMGIKESLEQANRREFISLDEVKKEVSALFKKTHLT
jgi:hypothetical protein